MAKDTNLGRVEAEFNEEIVNYANLIGKSKIELIEELFKKETEGKVLNKEYILLEEVFYFNFQDLQENKTVKASKVKPTANLTSTYIVKKIPNNLDVFDKTKRTFCYNGVAEEHKGVYSYNEFDLNTNKPKDTSLLQDYLLFEYNSKTEELVISLTTIDDIYLLLNLIEAENFISDMEDYNKLFSDVIEKVKNAPEDISIEEVLDVDYINLELYLTSVLVIEPYNHAKNLSFIFFKDNPEDYEKIKGRYNSKDLILFREINKIESEDVKRMD